MQINLKFHKVWLDILESEEGLLSFNEANA